MRVRAIASGALALVVLEVIVTSSQTERLGALFALPASWARWLIDPTVPAIGDHRSTGAPAAAPPASSGPATPAIAAIPKPPPSPATIPA